jgi:hypothetical protein
MRASASGLMTTRPLLNGANGSAAARRHHHVVLSTLGETAQFAKFRHPE